MRTLPEVSATEEELDSSRVDEVLGELTSDSGEQDGPNTAEIDALDATLVESLANYLEAEGADEQGLRGVGDLR